MMAEMSYKKAVSEAVGPALGHLNTNADKERNMSIHDLPQSGEAVQGINTDLHGLPHPTPSHIQSSIMDALHNAHEAGQHVPMHVFAAVRKGIAQANKEHDAGVL